jgi:hypothetical protein
MNIRWHTAPYREGASASDRPAAPYTASETVVLLVAGLSAVIGLIHVTAAVEQLDKVAGYARVYALLAAVELIWAALVARRSSRELLLFACGFNLLVMALWVGARSFGVSATPRPWAPGSVSAVHALFWCSATPGGVSGGWQASIASIIQPVAELVTVTSLASILLAPRIRAARAIVERVAPLLLCVLLLSVLYGVGAHAG